VRGNIGASNKHGFSKFNREGLTALLFFKFKNSNKMINKLNEVEKASKEISQLSGQLKGWNGSSSRGAAIYDSIFDAEVALDQAVDNEMKYFGMNEETKGADMDWECAEISACNMLDIK
jgi:hypothetical protein